MVHKLLILLFSVMVVACDSSDEPKHKATQVAAKVNGDEISVHQINAELSGVGNIDADRKNEVTKAALDKLVTEQILIQKAEEEKLDRNPKVLQMIEASKRKILARAYVQNFMLKEIKPSQDEIDTFYNEHPELFANRKVFRLQEIVIKNASEKLVDIQGLLGQESNMKNVAILLKDNGYTFSINANVRAAEQLQSGFLSKIQSLNDGSIVVVRNGQNANVVKIAESQDKPISKEQSIPVIEKYFVNKNRIKNMKMQMAALKKEAVIEYVGEFEQIESAQLDAEGVNDAEDSDSQNLIPENDDKNVLEKGLEGL